MPSRKEIQWSQLKVGALVLAGCALLITIIFLMNASTGGFLSHKITLRSYFPNAGGVKVGSEVTLEGVTIGNVIRVRVVPDRNPNPVEVVMQIGDKYQRDLHTDSTASIAAAGVLGDSFIDISSTQASGPMPLNNAEIATSGAPTIQSVIGSSQGTIDDIHVLIRKIDTLVDSLNSKQGTVGAIINDPALGRKFAQVVTNLQTITDSINNGKGSLGQFINDDKLYTKLNTAVDNINGITADLNAGKGTAGKFLKDETLYNNINSSADNLNKIVADMNAGNGTLGKLAKDPAFAKKLDDAITNLDDIVKGINAGEGTAGQLVKNRSLYDHVDQSADQAQQVLKAFRENPKKYLTIELKVF